MALSDFVHAVIEAQVVLPQNRRREINSIDGIAGEFRKRFVDNGFLPADVAPFRKGYKPPEEREENDPQKIRIAELTAERDELGTRVDELKTQNKGLVEESLRLRRELQGMPSEANVVKNFVADILYLWDAKKKAVPGASHLPEVSQVPKVLEEPRPPKHDSEQRQEDVAPKVHVAVVGGGTMHPWLTQELRDLDGLDLRLFDLRQTNQPIGERLRSFKDPAFGVVLNWTNYNSHSADDSLKFHNIPFQKYNGERGGMESLIRRIYNERTTSGTSS